VPSDSLNPRAPSSASFAAREEVDPELVALPDPPKKERTFTVLLLAVTAVASLAMIVALRADAAYAFASPSPAGLGELRLVAMGATGATGATSALEPNRFVQAEGMLGAAGAIRYEHPFGSDSYRVSPVAGRRDLWVEVRVPAGQENARYVPPTSFAGRLVPLDSAGPRHRGLAESVRAVTGEAVPEGAWLIVDGEQPADARWAIALMVLFGAFAVWNGVAIAKILRRVG
jgi:hypothetical protein